GFQWSNFSHAGDFEDILGNLFGGGVFGDLFGGGRGRRRGGPQRGADLQVRLVLTLEELATGVSKTIRLKRREACPVCRGTGEADGATPETCSTCQGGGEIRRASQTPVGTVMNVSTCPVCRGEGSVIRKPCTACHGQGSIESEASLSVNIPAGLADDKTLVMAGQGHKGRNGGPAGDLLISVSEKPHPHFKRQGDDILLETSVTFTEAALGAKVEIPTLTGRVRLTIPEGTQSGRVFRLRGKGMPHVQRHGHGDQLVTVTVKTPMHLSRRGRELLEELGRLEQASAG
ncbi:MAG: molecular chaperone DnaJ, partial [candidate division Zixibacteria bacterium]|nr:molecular chaperone DnaJ [candidate division Zixibacteria bacterium]